MASSTNLGYSAGGRRTSLVQIGASLGVASNAIGWAIFFLLCTGMHSAVYLSILPFGLALAGMVLTVVGATLKTDPNDVDTHVLASLFINLFGLIGGAFQMGIWLGWPLMAGLHSAG